MRDLPQSWRDRRARVEQLTGQERNGSEGQSNTGEDSDSRSDGGVLQLRCNDMRMRRAKREANGRLFTTLARFDRHQSIQTQSGHQNREPARAVTIRASKRSRAVPRAMTSSSVTIDELSDWLD